MSVSLVSDNGEPPRASEKPGWRAPVPSPYPCVSFPPAGDIPDVPAM